MNKRQAKKKNKLYILIENSLYRFNHYTWKWYRYGKKCEDRYIYYITFHSRRF
jgi:hypothetical protein